MCIASKSQKILNRTIVSQGPSVIPNLQVKNQLRKGNWLVYSYSLPTVLKDQYDLVIQHWQFLKVLLGTSLSSLHRSFHLLPPLLHCLLNVSPTQTSPLRTHIANGKLKPVIISTLTPKPGKFPNFIMNITDRSCIS